MVIGGLQKFSLSDFPGVIAAIVFTRGCGFRCPYCHNPELVDPVRYAAALPEDRVQAFLHSRRGRLQGVVVSGGEPTLHADLPEFLRRVKDMGFRVKLDTNGTNPLMLNRLVGEQLVDFIAMDIKAPLRLYSKIARAPVVVAELLLSIELIRLSGIAHEFRTTWLDALLSSDDILEIAEMLKGCKKYVLQPFQGGKVLEPGLASSPAPSLSRLTEIAALLSAAGHVVEVRR